MKARGRDGDEENRISILISDFNGELKHNLNELIFQKKRAVAENARGRWE